MYRDRLTRTFNTSGFMKFWNKRRMKKREASEEVKHVGKCAMKRVLGFGDRVSEKNKAAHKRVRE